MRGPDRPAEGLDFIDEAIEISGGAGPLPPLFYAMKGDLLLRRRGEPWFQHAFDQAAELGARIAAAARGDRAVPVAATRARQAELLRATYATFTEGFATPDLIEAKELLG